MGKYREASLKNKIRRNEILVDNLITAIIDVLPENGTFIDEEGRVVERRSRCCWCGWVGSHSQHCKIEALERAIVAFGTERTWQDNPKYTKKHDAEDRLKREGKENENQRNPTKS